MKQSRRQMKKQNENVYYFRLFISSWMKDICERRRIGRKKERLTNRISCGSEETTELIWRSPRISSDRRNILIWEWLINGIIHPIRFWSSWNRHLARIAKFFFVNLSIVNSSNWSLWWYWEFLDGDFIRENVTFIRNTVATGTNLQVNFCLILPKWNLWINGWSQLWCLFRLCSLIKNVHLKLFLFPNTKDKWT